MQHAQSRLRPLRWIGRGALASLAGLVAFGVSPALPALAASFTFAVGATSFGTGSGSRGSLGDLKIVPGRAVMLAADAVSTVT